ncbi:MAG TPA: hypothetical protein VM425_04435 [Myxococcota bacterium]|nr:hypothetical protein [Myxococcota bacterium]
MKKVLTLAVVMLAALAIGIVFIQCGGDDNGETCPAKCGVGLECCAACACATGTCSAEGKCEVSDCCPSAPQGKYHIDIAGKVIDASTGLGTAVAVAAISPTEALTTSTPELLVQTVSAADGIFALDCFDVTNVALGAVILTDDDPMDAAGGTYFPTGTGVIGWNTNAEKVCVSSAVAIAVPNAIVANFDQLPDIDSATEGFVMGTVVSAEGAPVEGAVIKKTMDNGATWVDLDKVYYPITGSTDMSGTATSANGSYVLPASNFVSITTIHAEKDGMTFDDAMVAATGGFCFFAMLPEAE